VYRISTHLSRPSGFLKPIWAFRSPALCCLFTRPVVGLVSSATTMAFGKVRVLPASALIVDRPVLIGLAAFGVLAVVTVAVCGARTFWLAAAVGHAGSTLLVYAIIGSTRLADLGAFARAATRPDFGVSAIRGAWVGTITATAWIRVGNRSPRPEPCRRPRLRDRWSRLVVAPRPLHPHHRAPLRILHRLCHRVMATASWCRANGSKPWARSETREPSPTRLGTPAAPLPRRSEMTPELASGSLGLARRLA
jgi:hypothetical protein